jgi:hypothetical protein
MATAKQKAAARENIKKAQAANRKGKGKDKPKGKGKTKGKGKDSSGISTAERNDLADAKFAFPKERKEPIHDAAHVRNAIARFDQVEGVSDAERESAWKRIKAAAKKYGVEVSEGSWRELFKGGASKQK